MTKACALLLLAALGACAAPPTTPAQREAVAACRTEADRALEARSRTDSLRNDERATQGGLEGYRGGTLQAADITTRERLIDECLSRRGAR